jgi:hypothetical protein
VAVAVVAVAINVPAAETIAPLPPAPAPAEDREIACGNAAVVETTAQTRAARKVVTVTARNVRPSKHVIARLKEKDARALPMASARKRNANPFKIAVVDAKLGVKKARSVASEINVHHHARVDVVCLRVHTDALQRQPAKNVNAPQTSARHVNAKRQVTAKARLGMTSRYAVLHVM